MQSNSQSASYSATIIDFVHLQVIHSKFNIAHCYSSGIFEALIMDIVITFYHLIWNIFSHENVNAPFADNRIQLHACQAEL